ncbi:MAG: right-handed parallel beta-helix repeat-containing protein [Massilibacteroides sp.]|nr:right-handed parallel beta-helix repeat-containing protein [Massilibacteroides sp.]
MNVRNLTLLMSAGLLLLACQERAVVDLRGKIKEGSDITKVIRKTVASLPKKDAKIILPKGTFKLLSTEMLSKSLKITNHDNGDRRIAFNLEGFDGITVEGDSTTLLFEGAAMPFRVSKSNRVTIKGINIDWEKPYFIQGEIIATDTVNLTCDIRFSRKGYDFKYQDGDILFPNQPELNYKGLGQRLLWNMDRRSPAYKSSHFDFKFADDGNIEKISADVYRLKAAKGRCPKVGLWMTFKGKNGVNRYAPAFHVINTDQIRLEDVHVYHALGMGFLAEKSSNITLNRFKVMPSPGTNRLISATADATHYCNCKGDVLMQDCVFENMLDDGTNVHGTYMYIDKVLDDHTLEASFEHFQQEGFAFAEAGDKTWFELTPDITRGHENVVHAYKPLNDKQVQIQFENPLPKNLKKGDLVENKTWNTATFTMDGCIVRHHRARNVVLKTPGVNVIKNCYFESMMASILLRAEAFHWYESGANENVTIKNNTFVNCTYGGGDQAVLYISPKLNKSFDQNQIVDKDIHFVGNKIESFDNRIVLAEHVDGLEIRDNVITLNADFPIFNPLVPLFDLVGCKAVTCENNQVTGRKAEWLGQR